MNNILVIDSPKTIILILLVLLYHCNDSGILNSNIVAVVDKQEITIDEFRQKYELDPNFPGYLKGQAGLKEYVEILLDKILAGKLAQKEDLENNSIFNKYLNHQYRQIVIKKYYERFVKNTISVSEEEVGEAILKSSVKLRVKHLFAQDSMIAENLYNSLKHGTSFTELAEKVFEGVDSLEGGADLGEITWGELDPGLEDVAFHLDIGEYSKPVRSRWGYHVLLVTDRKINTNSTKIDFQQKYDRIYKKLKMRKEEEAAGTYLKNFLNPFQITIKKKAFLKIVRAMDIGFDISRHIMIESYKPMTDKDIITIRNDPNYHPQDLFLSSTQKNWTIEEFLNKLEELPVNKRPQITSAARLKKDIGVFIRNEYIYEDALRKKIHQLAEVDSTVKSELEEIAYSYYLIKFFNNFEVPQKIARYYRERYKEHIQIDSTPDGILPGMNSPQSYKLYYSTRQLHNYLLSTFPDVKIQINDNLLEHEAKRINWNRPIRMFVIPRGL